MKDILKEFDVFDLMDNFDKTHVIMDFGKQQPNNAGADATRITSCQSPLYVWGSRLFDKVWTFNSYSTGLFSAGVAQILVQTASGYTSEELSDFNMSWFKDLNLEELVSMGRLTGLEETVGVIRGISQRSNH
jgi:sulfur transfer protein SufE